MMRRYGPPIVLLIAALWLALFGDGPVFGVIVLSAVAVACGLAERERQRLVRRRRRER